MGIKFTGKILDALSIYSDNVYAMCAIWLSFMTVIVLCSGAISKKMKGCTFIITESVSALVWDFSLVHLPVVHRRLHQALSITSSLIYSSDKYRSSFEDVSKMTPESELDIAKALFMASETERSDFLTRARPSMLYDKVFESINSIMTVKGRINVTYSIQDEAVIVLIIIAIAIMAYILCMKSLTVLEKIMWSVQVVVTAAAGTRNMILFFVCIWYCILLFGQKSGNGFHFFKKKIQGQKK